MVQNIPMSPGVRFRPNGQLAGLLLGKYTDNPVNPHWHCCRRLRMFRSFACLPPPRLMWFRMTVAGLSNRFIWSVCFNMVTKGGYDQTSVLWDRPLSSITVYDSVWVVGWYWYYWDIVTVIHVPVHLVFINCQWCSWNKRYQTFSCFSLISLPIWKLCVVLGHCG